MVGGRVGFAGEHTSAKHFGSSIEVIRVRETLTDRFVVVLKGFLHGAYFSGVRAADEIYGLVRGGRGE